MAEAYGVDSQGVQDALDEVERKLKAFDHPQLWTIAEGRLRPMRWGLIPSWVKDRAQALEIQQQTLNARAETCFSKASFRAAIRERRCIIPVEAFYEWQHQGKERIPYQIEPAKGDFLHLAGLWEVWHSPQTHTPVVTVSILTCAANPTMARIHNTRQRMPVLLDANDIATWLAPQTPAATLEKLLEPSPDDWITCSLVQ